MAAAPGWGEGPGHLVDVETDTGARLVCSWPKPRRRYAWATLHSCEPAANRPCNVGETFRMHLCDGPWDKCPVRQYPLSKWGREAPPACHGRPAAAADRRGTTGLALASPAGPGSDGAVGASHAAPPNTASEGAAGLPPLGVLAAVAGESTGSRPLAVVSPAGTGDAGAASDGRKGAASATAAGAPELAPPAGSAAAVGGSAGARRLALASPAGPVNAGAAGETTACRASASSTGAGAAELAATIPLAPADEGAAVAAAHLAQVAVEIAGECEYADCTAAVAWSLMTGRRLVLELQESCIEIPGSCCAELADAMGKLDGEVRASELGHAYQAPLRLGVGWVSRHDDECTVLHHASSLDDLVGKGKGIHFFPVYSVPDLETFPPHRTCDGSKCGGRGFPCSSRVTSTLSRRGLGAWPVLADGDCLLHSFLWCCGAADTKETRSAERAKIASFLSQQAASPPCCAAWAKALGRLQTPCVPAPLALASGAAPLALASAAEGAKEGGPRGSEEAAFVQGICNVAGLNPEKEMPDAGIVLGMLSDKGKKRALDPRPPKAEQPSRRRRGGYRSAKLEERLEIGRALRDSLIASKGEGKKCRLPRGFAADWLRGRLGREPTSREARAAVRHFHWVQRREGTSRASGVVLQRDGRKTCRAPSKLPLGRRKKAPLFREMLFQWFCSYRGTVKGRIFPETLSERAKVLRARYIAAHLETDNATPARINVPKITSHWLTAWRKEYHVSLRSPNKRWKVPRWIWKERVRIYWCNLLRLRRWVYRHHGYDPHIDSWDQKPIHRAEGGSKMRKTLAWKGGDVGIVENHGHARERWTAMTMCTTDRLRASAIPPAELLFKGGPVVLGRLQEELEGARADDMRAAHKVTVAVSPSASYATAEVLEFMRKHLEPLGGDREWRIASLDVYGPHKAKELIDVCWENGYVGPVLVAPGTTGSLQGNDTHVHGPFSKHYQYDESVTIAAKHEANPDSLGSMTHGDCIRCFCAAWDNPDMHLTASAFGVHNMLRGSFDGKQNRLGEGTLQELWGELEMEKLKKQCLAEVDEMFDRGQLPWAKETIALLVTEYPKRGCLDVYLPGQEDEGECVAEDGDTPWDDVPPHHDAQDAQDAIVAADEEEVRASGPPSSSCHDAAETSAGLLQAQFGVSKVESLDIMIEQARASGQHTLQGYLERERMKLMRQLTGAKQENPDVAAAVLGRVRLDEHERQRRAEEARHQKASMAAAQNVESKMREHACRLVLAEREVAKRQAEEQRRKAVEDAAVHLEPGMFAAAVVGLRTAQQNRWKAFERVLRVGGGMSPEQERNLRHDWEKWDAFESHKHPHGNDWANRFKAHLTSLLDHCRNGNSHAIQAWWEHKRRTCVGVHIALPALPQ